MRAVDVIRKKRDGHALGAAEIQAFISGVLSGEWPDYQTSALLMAIVLRGMTPEETAALTGAMVRSGERILLSDIPGPKVDKHSTGGVGDKTSLLLAPIVAACGGIVPMMSGRGLGHTGGTLDKLEAIPGFRVGLSLTEFRAVLREIGCAMIGQTAEVAPADRKLYALRDVTATVESIPLITASIMSKKIAEGTEALVLDVKYGRGAFMKTPESARALAHSLVATGNANGVRTEALLTDMNRPLGLAMGNAVEVAECLRVLRGEGPDDLLELTRALAARMLVIAGLAEESQAPSRVDQALSSGQALDKFRQMVERQGGDPRIVDHPDLLPRAPKQHLVVADRKGILQDLDAECLGQATVVLGAGRNRAEETVDPACGIVLRARLGDSVGRGTPLLELHYREESRLGLALSLLERAVVIGEGPLSPTPLILESIR